MAVNHPTSRQQSSSQDEGLTTDSNLLDSLKKGDASFAAWSQFVRQYGPLIYSWARRSGIQDADANDIAAIVISKLYLTINRFQYDRSKGRFRCWLKTVTLNAIRDLLRKNGKRRMLTNGTIEQLSNVDVLNNLVDELTQRYELGLLLKAEEIVRGRVKNETWQSYYLTFRKTFSPQYAAQIIGINVDHVHVYRRRVADMLQREIRRMDPDVI